ncbi:DUF4388 domain-containing protein [Hydrogenothermus marinus]|uniref:Uncharacterized protein DUF4388 n=1 Tax=Hydrogenothermus marinus TaxID=133270 RepID=A0A3M0BML1_9AQUI|nr:DUF4388 domain-containing protein [Hydrogenothermus marinus]RMA96068.1 uncharacterized protein DUF4388 [Hydrogenothermus marinus]
MAISGDLEIFNFVDIFQILRKDKKDGILVVESEDKKLAVYFKEGDIVFIRPVKKVFYIYLDIDFLAVLKKENLDKDDLYKYLVARLPILLAIKKGKFSFTSGFIKYPENIKPQIPIEKLIMYLSRQLSQNEVERKISDPKLIYTKAENFEELAKKAYLTDIEKRILFLIDGKKTVEDIKKELNVKDLTLKRALYGMLAAGIIKRVKREKKLGFNLTKNLLKKIVNVIKGL